MLPSRSTSSSTVLLLASLVLASPLALAEQDFERPPISYETTPADDAVERLKRAIDAGEVTLDRDERLGWLPAVLEQLGVPASSQTLVFSKTSLQRRHISPSNPRAVYFSDDVYVGYVRYGKKLELSAVDPRLGAVFYTVDQTNHERPEITRDRSDCLSCHATSRTRRVPGYLVRSVYPDKRGEPRFDLGTVTTDHTTPLAERFGGWYVTGSHGAARHRGNAVCDPGADPPIDPEPGANLARLDGRFPADHYAEPGSDLVALMVLEHQSQAHNLITRAAYEARIGAHYDRGLNRVLGQPEGTPSGTTERRIERSGEALLEYLLFSGETPLAGPVAGSSSFAEDFAALGPRDPEGRSLRDFDLRTRLFRYPCSFLIYSDAYDQLPDAMRDYLRRRLTEVLTGGDDSEAFSHLSAADRRAVFDILRATKPDRLLADAEPPAG